MRISDWSSDVCSSDLLLVVEFVAALAVTAFLLFFSIFVNAPLLELANFNETPNPSKAPWYFLGLQELLTMFHPMVAGVTIPGMGMFALRSEEHTSELQSLMRISYAVFCLKKKKTQITHT